MGKDYRLQVFLHPPKFCDNCNSEKVRFVDNSEVYGKSKGVWPFIYLCSDCKSYVSCHPNTTFPMGKLGTREVRSKRLQLHKSFDFIWKDGFADRHSAYIWLAEKLEIDFDNCHISWLSKAQLDKAILICGQLTEKEIEKYFRRKGKKDDSESKRHERESRSKQVDFERNKRKNQKGRRFGRARGN